MAEENKFQLTDGGGAAVIICRTVPFLSTGTRIGIPTGVTLQAKGCKHGSAKLSFFYFLYLFLTFYFILFLLCGICATISCSPVDSVRQKKAKGRWSSIEVGNCKVLYQSRKSKKKKGSTSHKLQKKLFQLFLFHEYVSNNISKVLRNPSGGSMFISH